MQQSGPTDLAAGSFASWLTGMQRALHGEPDSDVPCGDCTACCTAGQFVHVGPDETETLAHIPSDLLFPAPGLPRGHRVMGYDEDGHCPMFTGAGCSIYEHRPRTCRTYDCRIFPATGVEPDDGDPDKARIGSRARRWKFTFTTPDDHARQAAAQAAASYLRDQFAPGLVPANPTQLAVLAIEVHGAFLRPDRHTGGTAVISPPREVVEAEVRRCRGSGG